MIAAVGHLACGDPDVFAEAETAGLIHLARGGVEFSTRSSGRWRITWPLRPCAGPRTWRWPASCPGGTQNVPPGT